MKNYSFEYDYGIEEDIIKKLEEDVMKSLISSMFKDVNTYTSASTITSEAITIEKLKELQRQLLPYSKLTEDFYKYNIPSLKIKFEDEESKEDFLCSRFMYGMPVLKPTKTIYIKVQARKHKQKRINKKWLKKYGYVETSKEVPDYGIFMNVTA